MSHSHVEPLPQHDELSWVTRGIELSCIVVAVSLLGWHGVRFARMDGVWTWWLPLVAAAGMLSADFSSGLVHWTADTWGEETMPILGRRFLRPFRVHHVNPHDFLRRDVIDTNGDVAMIVIPLLAAAFAIPLSEPWGRAAAVYLVSFCFCGLPTNQVHQWAHRPTPPRWVDWLQRRGVLLSREAHARHHAAPYVVNYCITTGWCNVVLARLDFFRRLERLVTRVTGLPARGDDHAFAESVFTNGLATDGERMSLAELSEPGGVSPRTLPRDPIRPAADAARLACETRFSETSFEAHPSKANS